MYNSRWIFERTRLQGGGLVDLTDEEIITSVATVISNKHIHMLGCQAYKYTGTTTKFDGTEDVMIGKDARRFWDELGMRRRIDDEVAKLERKYKAGKLPWNWKTMQDENIPYPPPHVRDWINSSTVWMMSQ